MHRQIILCTYLCLTVFLLACGSQEPTIVAPNTPTFDPLEVIALDHSTLNIQWGNPALSQPYDIAITITNKEQVKTIGMTSADHAEIQYPHAAPSQEYQITVSTTLEDQSTITSSTSIITPPAQTGHYSVLAFDTATPCSILTCKLGWGWTHPSNPTSYVSGLILQRKETAAPYWQTVAQMIPETISVTDESLALDHGADYQYRIVTRHEDTTSSITTSLDPFTLSYTMPKDLIASIETDIVTENFNLGNIANMVQPSPFYFTMQPELNRNYSIDDLITKIGPIAIRPLLHVTNYDSFDSTFFNIATQTISGQNFALFDLKASPQNYTPAQILSFSSELILGANAFATNTTSAQWTDYEIFISLEIIPVDSHFTAAKYWKLNDDQPAFISNQTASKIKCNQYNCYVSVF